MTQVCRRCGEDKTIEAFALEDGRRRRVCRSCRSAQTVERVRNQKNSSDPRKCKRCSETKPTSDFRGAWCKSCTSAYQNALRQKSPARKAYSRNYYLETTYGISQADYEALLEKQGGGCAICGATRGAVDREVLCVDHNHVTGAVRGLLCLRCNFSVRDLGDDLDLALRTMEYVLDMHPDHPLAALVDLKRKYENERVAV